MTARALLSSSPDKKVITCGGTASGEECIFPFWYKGVQYDGCTTVAHNEPWCATKQKGRQKVKAWGNCFCPKEHNPEVNTTCGGTANGEACVFPFKYRKVNYQSCTVVDHDQPWCATQSGKYKKHGKWGNCECPYQYTIGGRTCGGTAFGASCVFPFMYGDIQYYGCTSVDHDQLWCATQSGDEYEWGNCNCSTSSVSEFVPRTCGGTANGSACVFPFTYEGMVYNGCTTFDATDLWCATQSGDVGAHDQWGFCQCAEVNSTCGSDNTVSPFGYGCQFPFIHESVAYYDCIDSSSWCVTDSEAGTQGYCNCLPSYFPTCGGTAGGDSCAFPFIYDGIKYYGCTDAGHDQLWCATETGHYEMHGLWGNCDCDN